MKGGDTHTKPAQLAITEAFNNCPGGNEIKEYFFGHNLNDRVRFVDLDSSISTFWKNDPATMVLEINKDETAVALALGKFGTEYAADEMDWETLPNGYVVRFWWD